MFFIGIFGIETKEKIIREIQNIYCKACNSYNRGKVIKSYTCFHFFFIPIFKWSEKYYVTYDNCNHIYGLSKEKGKSIESGRQEEISYWDLQEMDMGYYSENQMYNKCGRCGRNVEKNYTYCPYCGNKIQ